MSILKTFGNIFDIEYNCCKGNNCPHRVTLPQCSIRSIIHDEKGDTSLMVYPEVEKRDDIGVLQAKDSCFIEESTQLFVGEAALQYFHSNLRLVIDILAKVHLTKTSPSKQAN